jgi:geranylgeranyl diphosphate synthase, type II
MSLHPISDYFDLQGAKVNEYLHSVLHVEPQIRRLVESMQYSLLSGGKRLRPLLCLATARTLGVREEDVLPAASAIELVHCYSLIHDDLPCMDNDDLRRGQPTNHKVFGEATALLAGDGLLTYAFELLCAPLPVDAHRQLRMVSALSKAAGPYGMVGGQQADMDAEHGPGSMELLQYIHSHKTAHLIQAAVVIGALFADLPDNQQQAFSQYGLQIGLAFQMVDDWLDVVGTEAELGKRTGMDEQLQKLTYPKMVGVDQTYELAQKTCQTACNVLLNAGIEAPLLIDLAHYIVDRHQ